MQHHHHPLQHHHQPRQNHPLHRRRTLLHLHLPPTLHLRPTACHQRHLHRHLTTQLCRPYTLHYRHSSPTLGIISRRCDRSTTALWFRSSFRRCRLADNIFVRGISFSVLDFRYIVTIHWLLLLSCVIHFCYPVIFGVLY